MLINNSDTPRIIQSPHHQSPVIEKAVECEDIDHKRITNNQLKYKIVDCFYGFEGFKNGFNFEGTSASDVSVSPSQSV